MLGLRCLLFSAIALAALSVVGHTSSGPVRVGEPVPDFALPTVDGKKTVHLSDLRGKKVIVFAWASW